MQTFTCKQACSELLMYHHWPLVLTFQKLKTGKSVSCFLKLQLMCKFFQFNCWTFDPLEIFKKLAVKQLSNGIIPLKQIRIIKRPPVFKTHFKQWVNLWSKKEREVRIVLYFIKKCPDEDCKLKHKGAKPIYLRLLNFWKTVCLGFFLVETYCS